MRVMIMMFQMVKMMRKDHSPHDHPDEDCNRNLIFCVRNLDFRLSPSHEWIKWGNRQKD